jgi:hypothetical protein
MTNFFFKYHDILLRVKKLERFTGCVLWSGEIFKYFKCFNDFKDGKNKKRTGGQAYCNQTIHSEAIKNLDVIK